MATPTDKPVPFDDLHCTDAEKKDPKKFKSAYEMVNFKFHDYKTSNLEEYEKFLKSLNMADLQAEAYKNGFLPSDNKPMLFQRLTKKFLEETSAYRGPQGRNSGFPHLQNDPKKMAETMAILAKGR